MGTKELQPFIAHNNKNVVQYLRLKAIIYNNIGGGRNDIEWKG